MPLLDKISKATQDVFRGAKEITDTARQNSLISDERRQIENLYSKIGKLYHETHEADPDTELGRLCRAVNSANDRIAGYQEEIRKIKRTKRCPSCGGDIALDSIFCGICGARSEDAAQPPPQSESEKDHCKACGAELADESVFCTSCGEKQQ